MSSLLLVDDRDDLRTTAAELLRAVLSSSRKSEFTVVDLRPLETFEEYDSILLQHRVSLVIVDYRLGEIPVLANNRAVRYTGAELIRYLRQHRPQLPLFVVSSYLQETETETALDLRLGDLDGTFSREELVSRSEEVVGRLVRSAGLYFVRHTERLDRLGTLSGIAAARVLTEEERREIHLLQREIDLDLGLNSVIANSEYLHGLAENNAKLKQAIDSLTDLLGEPDEGPS